MTGKWKKYSSEVCLIFANQLRYNHLRNWKRLPPFIAFYHTAIHYNPCGLLIRLEMCRSAGCQEDENPKKHRIWEHSWCGWDHGTTADLLLLVNLWAPAVSNWWSSFFCSCVVNKIAFLKPFSGIPHLPPEKGFKMQFRNDYFSSLVHFSKKLWPKPD